MKIGLDIDGVILDFERLMRYYAELYDLKLKHTGKINNNFNYMKNYNWTDKESTTFKEEYLIKGTKEVNLIPGSKESIDLLHNSNYQIIIISSRGSINKNTKKYVLSKLKEFNIYYDEIYLGITNKVEVCQKHHIDIMIDDNPATCKELSLNKIKTIYFKDNDLKLRNNKYLKTFYNWAEILRYLLNNK